MKNKNLTVIEEYIDNAKIRKENYKKNTEARADCCLEEFFQNKLKFTQENHLIYKINETNYYLKFNADNDYFILYITEPFMYKSLVQISGLEALGDAALEIDEILNG